MLEILFRFFLEFFFVFFCFFLFFFCFVLLLRCLEIFKGFSDIFWRPPEIYFILANSIETLWPPNNRRRISWLLIAILIRKGKQMNQLDISFEKELCIFFFFWTAATTKRKEKKAWKKERRKGNYFEYEMDKSAGLTIYCYAGFDVLIISWVYSPLPLFSLFEVKWRDFLLFSFFFFDVVVVWLTSMLCIDIMRRLAALLLKDMAQIHHAFCCCCCCCCRLVFVASFTRLMMLAFWRSRGGRINGA